MIPLSESAIHSCFSATRRKRSISRRRPHTDPRPIIFSENAFTLPMSPLGYGRHGDANLYNPRVIEPERPGNERKLKKLKLKLGGVTRTLHAKTGTSDASGAQKHQSQASLMDLSYNNTPVHQVSKKRGFDDGFDEDDDEEIRYLKKLRASKGASGSGDRQAETSQRSKGTLRLVVSKHKDHTKKLRLNKDNDFGLQMASDKELKNTRDTEAFIDNLAASGQDMTMTTRRRALECPGAGGLVEFPNGLPDAPSKKQKFTELENQLRKAEIAQKRKIQTDRAAKEAEAEAIRKILGQDSSRKKREVKLKRQQDDLAQERTDTATTLRPKTIRLSMGPNGTIVTFSEDLGLPKIFNSLPCRYPPPREKCVGPNCTNAYKYRDSKSKLPLCSLNCYKAVQGNMGLTPAC